MTHPQSDVTALTEPIERIVAGIDGSPNGARALLWAISLGEHFDAELTVVHAVGLLAHLGDGPIVPSHPHLAELRRSFDDWCTPLSASGLLHRRLFLEGSPVPVLLEVAEREAADVIVVGSRGVGNGRELVLGSTSLQVAAESSRPVFIIPPENMKGPH